MQDLALTEGATALADFEARTRRTLSIASPEVTLRRPLRELVDATLDAAGRSAHTRRAYLTAIGQFLAWLDGERGQLVPPALALSWRPFAVATTEGRRSVWRFGETPAAILRLVDASTLDAYRAHLVASGASPNTASLRVYAIRTFLGVALRDGALTDDQARGLSLDAYQVRQPRDVKPVGRRLARAEARRLRGAVDATTSKGKRDLAILDVMLYAGLRRSEVAELRACDLRQDGGRWWLVLTGKGSKTRRLKVPDVLYRSLAAWLAAAGITWHDHRFLFCPVNKADVVQAGQDIDPNVVARLVAEYGHAASLAPVSGPHALAPHDLRRTCARNAYDNGASLLLVQAMLGHADPKTTAHYIGADFDDADTATDHVRY